MSNTMITDAPYHAEVAFPGPMETVYEGYFATLNEDMVNAC